MYQQFLEDPASVGETWREFFADFRAEPALSDGGEAPPRDGLKGEPEAPAAAKARAPVDEVRPRPTQPQTPAPEQPTDGAEAVPLRGTDAAVVKHMEASLEVPTATSVRTVPAKLVEVNRTILNRHLARSRGAKVSFTHLIGWAILRALRDMPGMRITYRVKDGKPHAVRHASVNLGLAVDVRRDDGSRTLLVPNIKAADAKDFAGFFSAYEDLIRKVRNNKLTPDDFAGTTHTITNPGMIGTVLSVPRLMSGQAAIVGVGSIGFPAEMQASDPRVLAEMGVGKVVTLTNTYDHRVIQGAESGEFLRRVHDLLIGEKDFYDEIFASMGVPYVPVRWRVDKHSPDEDHIEAEEKQARVLRLINNYRVRGHLIAPLDPLQAEPPSMHPELDPATYGLSIWDLDREFFCDGLAGRRKATLSEILGIVRARNPSGRSPPDPAQAQPGRSVRTLPAPEKRRAQTLQLGRR
jgi:2-oxoglutarate dehydrogenase E1 component